MTDRVDVRCPCGEHIELARLRDGARYCSPKCRKRYRRRQSPSGRRARQRWQTILDALRGNSAALRKCRQSARYGGRTGRLYENVRRTKRTKHQQAWHRFERAVTRRVAVAPTEEAQRLARSAVAKGAVAYENVNGLLGWVGPPVKREKAGRVYSRRSDREEQNVEGPAVA